MSDDKSAEIDAIADVLVIGAGPAGLAAAGALRRRGQQVAVLERSPAVADSWRRRHDHLRLNSHRWFSGLPGKRIERSAGSLPSRQAFIDYLEEYVSELEIDVQTGVQVERIDRASHGGWIARCADGDRHARHLIVATGCDRVPKTVTWPGQDGFPGTIMHAGTFRNIADHAGQDVMVVGAGNSGFDVTNHLVRGDVGRIWLSVRGGPTVLPLRVLGRSLHPFAVLNQRVPARIQDRVMGMTSRLFFGDLSRHGLPRPTTGAMTRVLDEFVAPALDDGTVAAMKSGRVEVVGQIDRFEGPDVVCVDGRRLRPDTVICATGYHPGLEPLVGHLFPLDYLGQPPASGSEPVPEHAGLWFIGVRPNAAGNMYVQHRQSRVLAKRIESALASAQSGPRELRRVGQPPGRWRRSTS